MLTIREAQQKTGLSYITFQRSISDGTIRGVKRGNKYLVYEEDFHLLPKPRNTGTRPRIQSETPVTTQAKTHVYPSLTFNPPDRQALEWMQKSGIGYRVTPSDEGSVVFQPALSDESDNQETGNTSHLFFSMIILVGLWILLNSSKHDKNTRRAERTLEQIGIEREDLSESQRAKTAKKLGQYPREERELGSILIEERMDLATILQAVR